MDAALRFLQFAIAASVAIYDVHINAPWSAACFAFSAGIWLSLAVRELTN